MNESETPRPNEYRVPDHPRPALCRSCNAPIIWTTTAANRPIPLSVVTIRMDESGARWALSHFADCPHADQHRASGSSPTRGASVSVPAWRPITMAFPPGAIVPVAGHIRYRWPDGSLALHFDERDDLYLCVLVTEFVRQANLRVTRLEHVGDTTRVTIV